MKAMTAMRRCPACGGEVHPIASRCKHCKADLPELEPPPQQPRAGSVPAPPVAAPPPPSKAPRAPSRPPVHPSQAAYHSPYGGYAMRPPGFWSRRWPLIVGALAIFAIGVSAGILIEQARSDDAAGPIERRTSGGSPGLVPDHMPDPGSPSPRPGTRPQGNPFAPVPSAPPASSAPPVEQFSSSLVLAVCEKAVSCGLNDSQTRALCDSLAGRLDDPDAAARVARGECHYDERQAERCLEAVRNMSCGRSSGDDLSVWLADATELDACAAAYSCL